MANGEVTTNEIMEFLQEHMVTHEELDSKLLQSKQSLKLELLDAIDEKLANLKGDLVVSMRRGDQKVNDLISLLVQKKLVSEQEALVLLDIHPFPQPTA